MEHRNSLIVVKGDNRGSPGMADDRQFNGQAVRQRGGFDPEVDHSGAKDWTACGAHDLSTILAVGVKYRNPGQEFCGADSFQGPW